MARVRSDGLDIAYDDLPGQEPALLLLPGWCESRAVFARIASRCAAAHRVLALDWRGHGESGKPAADFGQRHLVQDALALIAAADPASIVPVGVSHAGWVALELRRRLGSRVEKLVFLDWLVLDPPPEFAAALAALQDPTRWEATREQLFSMWLAGSDDPEVAGHIRGDMGAYGFDTWARAAREIAAAYALHGNPLRALAALRPPVPALHLYAQPRDDGYLQAQQAFAATSPKFRPHRLDARSHFPALEVPEAVAAAILKFVAG
jgi:pimeloyl-ACP methyl ester carboxylesterase